MTHKEPKTGLARLDQVEAKIHRKDAVKAKVATEAKPAPAGRGWIGIVFAVIAIGVIVLIGVMASRDSKATKTNLARWNALVHITRCLRDGTLPDFVLTTTAAVQDPRKPNLMFPQFSAVPESECLADLDTLAGAPAFASQIAALTEWQESLQNVITEETKLAAYYHHADWKDDRYQAGEAMWKAAQLAAHQQHDAVVVILAHVVPIIESELRSFASDYEARHGRDVTTWTLDLGYRLQLAADDSMRADTVKLQADLAALDTAAKAAPLDVRRATRARDVTARNFRNTLLDSLAGRRSPVVY